MAGLGLKLTAVKVCYTVVLNPPSSTTGTTSFGGEFNSSVRLLLSDCGEAVKGSLLPVNNLPHLTASELFRK